MTSARITYCETQYVILYLSKNFIPPQNRFLATPLISISCFGGSHPRPPDPPAVYAPPGLARSSYCGKIACLFRPRVGRWGQRDSQQYCY